LTKHIIQYIPKHVWPHRWQLFIHRPSEQVHCPHGQLNIFSLFQNIQLLPGWNYPSLWGNMQLFHKIFIIFGRCFIRKKSGM
jgi:hypothetical protein